MISPDRAGLQGKDKKRSGEPITRKDVLKVVGTIALIVLGFVAFSLASSTGRPWLRYLDLYVADGDPQRVVLAAVLWCWLLLVPITIAAWATRRFGRWGLPAWLLVVAGVMPLLVFLPTELLGGSTTTYPITDNPFGEAQAAAEDALGYGAPWGAVAWIAYVTLVTVLFASVFLSDLKPGRPRSERPGITETGGTWRAPVLGWAKVAVVWTVVWGAMAGLMLVTVDSFPGRGQWLATDAEQLQQGEDGVTGGFQVALDAEVADVVSCDEAAAAIDLDGGAPELPGCRSALLVSATGVVVDEDDDVRGGDRETGAVVGVVLQTRVPTDVEPLQDSLDGATLTAAAGLPEPPGRTIVTSSDAAYAVFVTAEDPGDAPAGEGSAEVPLTRSLAYLVIGTAQELYVAPNPV